MKNKILISFVMILFLISFASANVLFYEDFEDALKIEEDWRYSTRGIGSQGLTIEQIRAGSSACKFSCTGSAEDYVRQELIVFAKFNNGGFRFTIGDEYWIGFSIFLAEGYYSPTGPGTWGPIHQQCPSTPDEPPTCDWTEGIRNPIQVIQAPDGNWKSWIQWDSQQCTPLPKVGVSTVTYDYGPFSTGQWYDFVINVKWSYNADGFLKIWKNGVLETDRIGGTCFNDDRGPYLKIGMYGKLDQDQTMTIYYDELRVGDANSNYNEVAPGGTPPPPTCQSQGYQCCDSCESGPHPEYDADCPGQVCCGVCYVPDNIIDNGNPGTLFTGTWQVSGGANPYGSDSLYSKDNGATYTFTKSVNGNYNVSLWWTEWESRSNNVAVEIRDSSTLLDTVYVNQQINGGQWNLLGTYSFTGTAKVTIISIGNGNSTCADAVKFDLVSTTCGSADTNSDGVVSIIEIMTHITEWKAGSVTIENLMIGIGEWKNGC